MGPGVEAAIRPGSRWWLDDVGQRPSPVTSSLSFLVTFCLPTARTSFLDELPNVSTSFWSVSGRESIDETIDVELT